MRLRCDAANAPLLPRFYVFSRLFFVDVHERFPKVDPDRLDKRRENGNEKELKKERNRGGTWREIEEACGLFRIKITLENAVLGERARVRPLCKHGSV